MKLALVKASTDQTVYLFIQDSSVTTGAGLTGLVYNTASLVCYYVRPGATAAALTLATQTVAGAHSDGGFVEVDATNMPGVYRLDLSDAILATGVPSVVFMLQGAADMAPLLLEIQLTSADLNDATDMGLTNLDAAISSRSAYDGLDTSGVTTLLVRLSAARAGYLDELAAANLPADIAALPDAAAINAEVVDVLATDTIAELTTDPGATPTHRQIAALLYMWLRNANTATATTRTIANNAGVDVFSAATSDDGTTFSQGKLGDA